MITGDADPFGQVAALRALAARSVMTVSGEPARMGNATPAVAARGVAARCVVTGR
jgi:hypothetical protein